MKLLKCAIYLALTGIVGFFSGRIMPKRWIKPEKGWFRSFAFEKNGAVYEKLGIRKWQNKVPDMSRILPFLMPAKNLSGDYEERLPVMIRETCVAEIVHIAVSILGLPCLWMWPGAGGVIVTAIFIGLLNLPFILIQRYNRPRLIRLHQKLQGRRNKKEENRNDRHGSTPTDRNQHRKERIIMAKGYVIYNPLAGNGKNEKDVTLLQLVLDEALEYYDMTRITNYTAFLKGMNKDDYLVIVGGDGTLNRFVNDTNGIEISQEILYFPSGSGNDFARELGTSGNPVVITQYLKNLPSVEVKGKRYRFINGVGFGIDGYCCQVGDELKKTPGKKVNYTAIAIKGLLFHFQARNAKVTVDGKEYTYKKVWIAPTMHGKYYGGGMIPTPEQNRSSGNLSVMLFHGAGRLRTLCVFPSIFKGAHVKHTNMAAVHTGHEITVEFDRPTPLQIDGETILDVTKYTAKSAVKNINKAKEFAAV